MFINVVLFIGHYTKITTRIDKSTQVNHTKTNYKITIGKTWIQHFIKFQKEYYNKDNGSC